MVSPFLRPKPSQGDAIVKSKERSVRESVCARVSCFAERT